MARKKKSVKKVEVVPRNEEPYQKGDFLYYLDYYNKVHLAEVQKAFIENDEQCYEVVDQASYKFLTVPERFCHDDPKVLKKKKRENL